MKNKFISSKLARRLLTTNSIIKELAAQNLILMEKLRESENARHELIHIISSNRKSELWSVKVNLT